MAVSVEVDPNGYLETTLQPFYRAMKDFPLTGLHRFFTQKHSTSKGAPLKVLDYGCGPVLAYDISAAGANAETVLAEYGEKCRNALQDWLNHSPSAWDWTLYIKHVVCDLEGKDETEVQKRDENLQKAIKAVVPCDITQDSPIAEGYEGPYNVVMSMLCIENGCLMRNEYEAAMQRLATLVKKGRNLLLYSSVRNREENDDTPGYYYVGEESIFK